MGSLRNLRRRLTSAAVINAARGAPFTPGVGIRLLEALLARGGPVAPKLARMVRANMQHAEITDARAADEYFEHAARHLTNGLRVLKWARHPQKVIDLARQDVTLDDTLTAARQTIAAHNGGGIIAPAHCQNYLVSLVRLNQDIPISIYLRWNKDPRRVELKRRWCAAAGLDVIVEPKNLTNPAARAEICVEAIRNGKTLAITPDLPQKAEDGVPVRWLDRTIYLPSGPASLAMLAEVPLLPLFATYQGKQQVLSFEAPIPVERLTRAAGGRKEATRRATQTWADGFAAFVRNCPAAWYLWADNRWTRVLRNDPRYVDPISDDQTTHVMPRPDLNNPPRPDGADA